MTDIHGGLIVSGEDSEEDELEEDEFNVNNPWAEEQYDASTEIQKALQEEESKTSMTTIDLNDTDTNLPISIEMNSKIETTMIKTTTNMEFKEDSIAKNNEIYGLKGIQNSIYHNLQSQLNASLQRIQELQDNQSRLLVLLEEQHESFQSNIKLEQIAKTMAKISLYREKLIRLNAIMTDTSSTIDSMKRKAENLRINAQSHAIKKENLRDNQSQWNKLYAAPTAPSST